MISWKLVNFFYLHTLFNLTGNTDGRLAGGVAFHWSSTTARLNRAERSRPYTALLSSGQVNESVIVLYTHGEDRLHPPQLLNEHHRVTDSRDTVDTVSYTAAITGGESRTTITRTGLIRVCSTGCRTLVCTHDYKQTLTYTRRTTALSTSVTASDEVIG